MELVAWAGSVAEEGMRSSEDSLEDLYPLAYASDMAAIVEVAFAAYGDIDMHTAAGNGSKGKVVGRKLCFVQVDHWARVQLEGPVITQAGGGSYL